MKLVRYAALFVLTTCIILPANAVMAAANPCEALKTSNDQSPYDRFRAVISNIFDPSPNRSDAVDLYFTTQSDFSIQPVCWKNKETNAITSTRGKGLFYPIGTVVRIIGDAKIANKLFKLVETEHGIRTFMPSGHLTKLESSKAYVFSDSADHPKQFDPKNQFAVLDLGGLVGELDDDGIPQCQKVSAQLFNSKKLKKPLRDIEIDLCQNGGFDARLKIATRSHYQKVFAVEISGALMDTSGDTLNVILPRTRQAKDCGEKYLKTQKSSVEAGGEVKIPIYVLELKFGGDVIAEWQRMKTLTEKLYIHYGSYNINLFGQTARVVPVQSMFECDSIPLDPQKPIKFSLTHPISDSLGISFKLTTVLETLNMIDASAALSTAHVQFRKGHFWRVRTTAEYFRLRDAIRQIVEEPTFDNHMQLILGDKDKPLERKRLVEFLTHMILLATTEFG